MFYQKFLFIMTKEINIEEMIKNRVEISEKDEYMHDLSQQLGKFPRYHNESWYFNFIDRPNKVFLVSRISLHMDKNKSRILVLLVVDGKTTTYFNEVPLKKMPNNWEFDKKIKFFCIEPMKEWRITFEDQKHELDLNFKGRFSVFNSADAEDPEEFIKKYGKDLLKVVAQEHYEQPMIATGTLKLKNKGETRDVKGFGNRDHSWGVRHYIQIDGWYWGAAQFENETFIMTRSELLGKVMEFGVILSKDKENAIIEKVDITTKTKDDGKTPLSSTIIVTDKKGNKRTIESKSIHFMYLTLPTRTGKTEIFEQVAVFTCEGKEGDGISEYLISTRNQ